MDNCDCNYTLAIFENCSNETIDDSGTWVISGAVCHWFGVTFWIGCLYWDDWGYCSRPERKFAVVDSVTSILLSVITIVVGFWSGSFLTVSADDYNNLPVQYFFLWIAGVYASLFLECVWLRKSIIKISHKTLNLFTFACLITNVWYPTMNGVCFALILLKGCMPVYYIRTLCSRASARYRKHCWIGTTAVNLIVFLMLLIRETATTSDKVVRVPCLLIYTAIALTIQYDAVSYLPNFELSTASVYNTLVTWWTTGRITWPPPSSSSTPPPTPPPPPPPPLIESV